MANKTKIAWTEAAWNPVVGCTKVSAGCKNCYAERMALRQAHMEIKQNSACRLKYLKVVDLKSRKWSQNVYCDEKALEIPLHWREPRRIFVCSMGDLFHKSVPFEFIDKVWEVASKCGGRNLEHTLQFLTKRPERMLGFTQWLAGDDDISIAEWPRNCWLGTTVEHPDYKHRIDTLRQVPAAVRFLSIEPCLADMGELNLAGIDWVIVGGESGPGARPMHPDWARNIRDQCKAAGVPFFFKQWGEYGVYGPNQHFDVIHWRTKTQNDAYKFLHPTDCCVEGCTDGSWPMNVRPDEVELVKKDVKTVTVYRDVYRDVNGRFATMARLGKKKAGFLLDGEIIQEYPK